MIFHKNRDQTLNLSFDNSSNNIIDSNEHQNNSTTNTDQINFVESSFNHHNNNNNNFNIKNSSLNKKNIKKNEETRKIKVNIPIQEVKYCSNSIRFLNFSISNKYFIKFFD